MPNETFKAIVVDNKDGDYHAAIQELQSDALPEGDVLVSVKYSSLNYKDGLAVTGQGKVIRKFPLVPGIDLAGVVQESDSPDYEPGDEVVLTGWGVGERYWGGYTQLTRVKSEWLVPLPKGLSLQQAMGIGTAGFTAMLCVLALEKQGLTPDEPQEVVVTGASGGVGSIAAALLATLGYNVVASTGRPEAHDYLGGLGVKSFIGREELSTLSKRPLKSARWAGAVDAVGGDTLASLLKMVVPGGSVAACGNAGGAQLNTTVFPFILRGVNLLGIDSVMCPGDTRREAWRRLASDLPPAALDQVMQVVSLPEVLSLSEEILQGKVRGRVVVDVTQA